MEEGSQGNDGIMLIGGGNVIQLVPTLYLQYTRLSKALLISQAGRDVGAANIRKINPTRRKTSTSALASLITN